MLPFVERNIGKFPVIDIGPDTSARLSKLYTQLKSETTEFTNGFWRCRSRSYLIEILSILQYLYTEIVSRSNAIETTGNYPKMNEIVLFLHNNYNKKITIGELTNLFHINRTTLNKTFHLETGLSIFQYLIMLRIKTSAVMIRDTELPISEIAFNVGFNDLTYFGKMFCKSFNFSPSEYRKNIN